MNVTKLTAAKLIELLDRTDNNYQPSEQVKNGAYLAQLLLDGAVRPSAGTHRDIYRAWQEAHYAINNNG